MSSIFLYLLFYKLASLGVGALSIFLGYRLFTKGIWGSAGDFRADANNMSLMIKNGAPGTFFAAFGMIVVAAAIAKGFNATAAELLDAGFYGADDQGNGLGLPVRPLESTEQ